MVPAMDIRREWGLVASGVKIGAVVGLLAFVVRFSLSDRTVVNGVETSCSYIDLFAFVAAVVCAGCAVEALTASRRKPYDQRATLHMVAAAVLIGLVAVHALRGFGMILSPC